MMLNIQTVALRALTLCSTVGASIAVSLKAMRSSSTQYFAVNANVSCGASSAS
jgi:hypothetical protein